MQEEPHEPYTAPAKIPTPEKLPNSLNLDDLELMPKIKWYDEMEKEWTPGEEEAIKVLRNFLKTEGSKYGRGELRWMGKNKKDVEEIAKKRRNREESKYS